jgi:cation diffusion facilitator family transporter
MEGGAVQRRLVRLMWLSVAAALVTIGLKASAWAVTGSVGLLADAAESLVNLAAAVLALVLVRWAMQPPDEEHAYGHDKADYLSAGAEGALILVAAGTIVVSAVGRLLDPRPVEAAALGVALSSVAALVNLGVARVLIGAGREHRSLILEADGRHLMTDVWTTAGVVAGIAIVAATGLDVLDPVLALLVAANIVRTGLELVSRSAGGLMDRALEPEELARVQDVLARHSGATMQFHALRTRRAGRRAFVDVHVLVPGDWSVQRGHDAIEQVEDELRQALGAATVLTHLEPLEDPASFADVGLDRAT